MVLFIKITRWIARVLSLLLALFLLILTLAIGSSGKQTSINDIFGIVCFGGFTGGLILSWPKEKLGIVISYISFACLIALSFYRHEKEFYRMFYVLIPTSLLLMCRILEGQKRSTENS